MGTGTIFKQMGNKWGQGQYLWKKCGLVYPGSALHPHPQTQR
jgi:hypothetical protein